MSEDPLTTQQAARILGVSAIRVRQLIAAGRLPARKAGRDWLIEAAAIDALPARKTGWPQGRPRGRKAGHER